MTDNSPDRQVMSDKYLFIYLHIYLVIFCLLEATRNNCLVLKLFVLCCWFLFLCFVLFVVVVFSMFFKNKFNRTFYTLLLMINRCRTCGEIEMPNCCTDMI